LVSAEANPQGESVQKKQGEPIQWLIGTIIIPPPKRAWGSNHSSPSHILSVWLIKGNKLD
jgi:hypothetical protein